MHRGISLLIAFALAAAAAVPQDRLPSLAPYRHGYYLFLADLPVACEACYVPLLLTAEPLEEIAKTSGGQDADLITTYERDSIFQINGIVHVAPSDVDAAPRTIRVRKRNYRYQEITAAEILRLLQHPNGTIPVSRPMLHSELAPGPGLDALIAAFRAVK